MTVDNDLSGDSDIRANTESELLENASAFRGKFLDDSELISLQDKNPGGKYLPSTDSKTKRHYYISLEKFEELYEAMENSILTIGNEMYSGKAFADADITGSNNPCKYCEIRAFCRRSDI